MEAMSASIGTLSAALAKAQGEMGAALIDGSAKVTMKAGGTYSYTYASMTSVWSAIRKPLSDNGLAVIQRIDDENGVMFLHTILSHESGEYITSRLSIGQVGRPAQETGSAITYARRYALSALVGVVTDEDDDGAAATKGQREQPKKQAGVKPQPAKNSNAKPLPFAMNATDAVNWAMEYAPAVWPADKEGVIVRTAVVNSLGVLSKQGLTGDALALAWIAKVDDKLATWEAAQTTDDGDGWADVDAAGHDVDEPQFS